MNCPHCGVHVDEHEASSCFDAWIAADVMELAIAYSSEKAWYEDVETTFVTLLGSKIKDYSGDIAAAWQVLMAHPERVTIWKDKDGWTCCFYAMGEAPPIWRYKGKATTAHLAICRAAIKATKECE